MQGDEDRPYKQNNNTNCNIFFYFIIRDFMVLFFFTTHAFKLSDVVSKESLIKLNLLAVFGWTLSTSISCLIYILCYKKLYGTTHTLYIIYVESVELIFEF